MVKKRQKYEQRSAKYYPENKILRNMDLTLIRGCTHAGSPEGLIPALQLVTPIVLIATTMEGRHGHRVGHKYAYPTNQMKQCDISIYFSKK